jgi:hypothetical protein
MNSAARIFKSDCWMKRRYNIGSSNVLGFRNSKDQASTASAPDEPTVRVAVHLMPSFKSSRDTPRILLQHRMNWWFSVYPAVHPTLVFKLDRDAPSGWPSTPDKSTVSEDSVGALTWTVGSNGYTADCETPADPTLGQGEPSVNPMVQLFRRLFQRLAFLARPIYMAPLRLLSSLCHY